MRQIAVDAFNSTSEPKGGFALALEDALFANSHSSVTGGGWPITLSQWLGGEIALPSGQFLFRRGIRVPARIDDHGRWCLAAKLQGDGGLIYVDGDPDCHEFFVLEVTSVRGRRIKFRWSKDGGRNFGAAAVTVDLAADPYVTLFNNKIKVAFDPQQTYVADACHFWIGSGLGPLPKGARISGEGTGQGGTRLDFDFSMSGGFGDAFCAGFEPRTNAAGPVWLSDLSIQNLSKSNHLSAKEARRYSTEDSGRVPPPILVDGLPMRRDFRIEAEVEALAPSDSVPVFKYSTSLETFIDGGVTREAWFEYRNSRTRKENDFIYGEGADYRANLPGTGVRLVCPDNLKKGDRYVWDTTGYDGAAIVAYGANGVTAHRVDLFGFSRGVSLHVSLRGDIRECLFSPSPFGGGHPDTEVTSAPSKTSPASKDGGGVGVWLTNFVSDKTALSLSGHQLFAEGAGATNLHLIDSCKFSRWGVAIWHEDGTNHIVRHTQFDSAIVSAEFGTVFGVRYECCYFEGPGTCGEVLHITDANRKVTEALVESRGTLFGATRPRSNPIDVSVENCVIGLQFRIPVVRLANGSTLDAAFERNRILGSRNNTAEAGTRRLPLIETDLSSYTSRLGWNSSFHDSDYLAEPRGGGFSMVSPSARRRGGFGIGTTAPAASLHVSRWSGIESPQSRVPVFQFDAPGQNFGSELAYSMDYDFSTLHHVIRSSGAKRGGAFKRMLLAVTDDKMGSTKTDAIWSLQGGECSVLTISLFCFGNGQNFGGFWKLRAVARRFEGHSAAHLVAEPGSEGWTIVDHAPPADGLSGQQVRLYADNADVKCELIHGMGCASARWTIETEVLQNFS